VASVLVIDDDAAARTTIKLLLEREGHDVAVAADGRAGVAAIETGDFRLLIVDIFMPGMDGIETLRAVRERQPDLPVIAISGAPFSAAPARGADFLAMAVKLGAVRSMQKPFKPRDMIKAIEECLGGAPGSRGMM
jgi:CheY-like chemotaxis protein